MVDDFLYKGLSFAQETTISDKTKFINVKKAISLDYLIRLFYIVLDTVVESIIRINNKIRSGGHNVDTKDVLRRFEKRFEVLKILLPLCDEVVILYNGNGFVKVSDKNEWYLKINNINNL
ncbi:MAG: hypothetical protein FWG98_00550 [Candidatus Cloacimonetes bacterium]|nr:hypothetical protein [Candidatus Cloacimonadota bacterium]